MLSLFVRATSVVSSFDRDTDKKSMLLWSVSKSNSVRFWIIDCTSLAIDCMFVWSGRYLWWVIIKYIEFVCDDFIQKNLQPITMPYLIYREWHVKSSWISSKSMMFDHINSINSTTGWLMTPTALCFSLQSDVQSSNSYRIYKFKSIYSSVLFIAHNRAKIELISSERKESKDTAQSEDFSSNEWLKRLCYRQNFYPLRHWFDFTNFICYLTLFFTITIHSSTRAYHKFFEAFLS